MAQCKDGHRLVTATRLVQSFVPDSEPFEAGTVEDCGLGEIETPVIIGILWCPVCEEVVKAWIEES